jgi:hypothetical protein
MDSENYRALVTIRMCWLALTGLNQVCYRLLAVHKHLWPSLILQPKEVAGRYAADLVPEV